MTQSESDAAEIDRLRVLLNETFEVLLTAMWANSGDHANALDVARRVSMALGKRVKIRASSRFI